MPTQQRLLILGSGPAGMTAALYAARALLQPVVLEGSSPGGQLMGNVRVENWPGEESIKGPILMEKMRAQATRFGAQFISQEATRVDFSGRPLKVWTDNGSMIETLAIIIATGASPRRLGCEGEDLYWGKGVSTCAVCDGALYKDKSVTIVGGGDTAMDGALFLEPFASSITIVQKEPMLTASKILQKQVLQIKKVSIIFNSSITQVVGNGKKVEGVRVTHEVSNSSKIHPTDALFIAIGLDPNTAIFNGHITLDQHGYIKSHDHTKTTAEGVFVAGDAQDFLYRQAITAAGEGCRAALDAERYLRQRDLA